MPIAQLILALMPLLLEVIKQTPDAIDAIQKVIESVQKLPPEVQVHCLDCLKEKL